MLLSRKDEVAFCVDVDNKRSHYSIKAHARVSCLTFFAHLKYKFELYEFQFDLLHLNKSVFKNPIFSGYFL
ncbi:MAG: hypothetical protein COY58_02285 [Gammaproteobacteria bacterium CG_4_10_14_0_8_um_filter_38_16]|nr:MAG: hypothetical protein COY58_02285 [Gammaproteobacteria bacterium CG_4_10_14_0_8_um_filter_38_16]PJA03763.1 MAG: hypothetical protein COX72_02445 [Gammaproteobacteria bacterium CG_4_10_14_0_2_um_filter_38_22]